jgi:GNAT superfamily N-acetyltransferase
MTTNKKQTMEVKIREATFDDLDGLFELSRSFVTSFELIEDEFTKSLESIIGNASNILLVAEYDDSVVGYCLAFDHLTFYANGRVSWIEEITVKKSMRGQGVGRQLIQDIELWAVARNSKLISLATRRASEFYQAVGYEESAIYYRKIF